MIYPFRCLKCNAKVEVDMPIGSNTDITHECGGNMTRIYLPTTVHYRGSGFYTTDKVLYEPTDEELDDDY